MAKKRSLTESGLDTDACYDKERKKRKKSHPSHTHSNSDDHDPKYAKKKKKHKKSKNGGDSSPDLDSKYINHSKWKYLRISHNDFYRLRTEFGDWALKRHKKYLDEMETTKCKRFFKKFIKKWNDGQLEQKYYETFTSLSVDNHEKTRYKWSFEKNINEKEQMKFDLVRDSIDNQTNDTNIAERTAQRFQRRFDERRQRQENKRKGRKEASKDRKQRREEKKQKKYLERQQKDGAMFASYQSFVSSSNSSKKRRKK